MSHDHYVSPATQMMIEMASIRRAVQERGECRRRRSTPVLRPLHRMIRDLAGVSGSHPVVYRPGHAEPHQEGESYHWTTRSGRPVRYPGAYGWPMTYHRSTICAVVGIDWPGLRTPDPSLAWRSDASAVDRLIAVRQSVPTPITIDEVVDAWNEEYRTWLMSQCAEDVSVYAIERDEYGTLVEIQGAREPVRAVRVQCPTTGREYLLRVPPTVATAHEAVAWTFGLTAEEYRPGAQS